MSMKTIKMNGLKILLVISTLMAGALHAETYRVNIGGGAYTDVGGNNWTADAGCDTGNLSSNLGPIQGTLDEFLFLTNRWDSGALPEMTCSYVVQPGDYQVTLYFAETNTNNFTIGARVFDVNIEGALAFGGIDMFLEAGGNTALLKTTTVTVNDGQLDIQFLHQAKNPLIKAIEILPVGGGGNTAPVITTSPATGATVGVPYSYDVDATDSVGDTLQYFLDVSPTTMTIDVNTGVISWTPVTGDEGSQPVTVRVQDQGGLEDIQSYTLTVVAPSAQSPIRVNIGGAAYTDSNGNNWSADTGCNTGTLSSNLGPIQGTLDEFLFLTNRWDSGAAPEMTCSYAVQSGDYQVTLYFAETNTNNFTVGARVFDVNIEAALVFSGVDMFLEAGGNTALLKTTTVTVADGQLDIQFLHQVKNPLVKAIEIVPAGGGGNTAPVITTSPVTNATVGVPYSYDVDATDSVGDTLQYFLDVSPATMTIDANTGVISWTPVAGDEGLQSVTVKVQDQGGLANTQTYSLTVAGAVQLPIRVNIGGGAYTDSNGNNWSADAGCNTGNLSSDLGPIQGTLDETLFLTHRWDSGTAPEMTCSYNVPNGAYEVTLYFAETNVNNFTNGARVFDVTMEGILEFSGVDMFQEAGGNTALLKTTTLTVTDGQLNIQFLHQVKNPLVKAILIRDLPTGACSSTPRTQVLNGILPVSGGTGTETLVFSIQSNGSLGTATITDAATGQFQYLPNGNAWGADTFTYQVVGLPGGTVVNTYTVILEPRIMPLGDSITTGVEDGSNLANILPPDNLRVGWRLPLYNDLVTGGYAFNLVGGQNHGSGYSSFDPNHEGHGGWTATDIAWGQVGYPTDGVRAWLEANPADFILLHAGTNGLVAGGDIEIEAILDEIDIWENSPGGNSVMVILAQIIDQNPINPVVTTFNANVLAMADDRISNPLNPAYPDNIVVVDQQSALVYPADIQDGVHPNPTGYTKMKNVWKTPLNMLLPLCP